MPYRPGPEGPAASIVPGLRDHAFFVFHFMLLVNNDLHSPSIDDRVLSHSYGQDVRPGRPSIGRR